MPTPITNAQLDGWCQQQQAFVYPYYPIAGDFFGIMYRTGCRTNELLQINRWFDNFFGTYDLTPEKGNTSRNFSFFDLTPAFITDIENQRQPFEKLTIYQIENLFKKLQPQPQIISGDKQTIFYPFRYNFIRKLHDNGQTDGQIAATMGYTSTTVIANYLSANLYFEGF